MPAIHENESNVIAILAPRDHMLYGFHRCHHVVAGAIALGCFPLQHHLPGPVHTGLFVEDRRAGEVAARLFQLTPAPGSNAYVCMQTKTVGVGA